MLIRHLWIISLIAIVVFVTGCPPTSTETDECVLNDPFPIAETTAGEWTAPNQEIELTFTIPEDPYGGILDLGVISGVILPSIEAQLGDDTNSVGSNLAVRRDLEVFSDAARLVFEVESGQDVTVQLTSDATTPLQGYPVNYSFSWVYSSRVDCFEPNDTREEAKAVTIGEDQEAYFLSRRQDTDHGNHDDWYAFTLTEKSDVTVSLMTVPADIATAINLFDGDGVPVTVALTDTLGAVFNLTADELPAGDYTVQFTVDSFGPDSEIALGQQLNPEHFFKTYTFRVDATPTPPPSGQLNECMPYVSIGEGGFIGGNWVEANDENEHTFTVPTEPGAGIVVVTLFGPPVGPNMVIEMGTTDGSVGNDLADNGGTSRLAFEAGPGQEVLVRAVSDKNAQPDEYPVGYSITWNYSSRVDCYEPNDTEEDATAIPTDMVHEAYFLSKRSSDSHVDHDDWYRFTLTEARDVTITLLTIPSDIGTTIKLYDDTGAQIGGNSTATTGGLIDVVEAGLDPGEYKVKFSVGRFASSSSKAQGDQPNPPHFDETYTFRIDTNTVASNP